VATNDILIETMRIGTLLRVTAMDAASGTEIVFQAPASTSRDTLHRLATNKLAYVMAKNKAK